MIHSTTSYADVEFDNQDLIPFFPSKRYSADEGSVVLSVVAKVESEGASRDEPAWLEYTLISVEDDKGRDYFPAVLNEAPACIPYADFVLDIPKIQEALLG